LMTSRLRCISLSFSKRLGLWFKRSSKKSVRSKAALWYFSLDCPNLSYKLWYSFYKLSYSIYVLWYFFSISSNLCSKKLMRSSLYLWIAGLLLVALPLISPSPPTAGLSVCFSCSYSAI
jgi:hypothetical protein